MPSCDHDKIETKYCPHCGERVREESDLEELHAYLQTECRKKQKRLQKELQYVERVRIAVDKDEHPPIKWQNDPEGAKKWLAYAEGEHKKSSEMSAKWSRRLEALEKLMERADA